ncbi:MAG: hypothetical protein GC200_03915 [Tepidisphaera sp.]|nr:hypothetical protein [Tepidisphaera sp.]
MNAMLEDVRKGAEAAGVFGEVVVRDGKVWAAAKGAGDEAFYVAWEEGGKVWVGLQTPARYLSQSIEADLVNTGDKLEELILEELIELGYEGPALACEHYRDAGKLYTFRSAAGSAHVARAEAIVRLMVAYEACFRRLGDMEAGAEEA